MSVSPLPRCVLLLLVAMVMCSAAFLLVAPKARAGAAVVFSEDFEHGPLGPQWTVGDSNNLSGLDYWGISNYRAHGGNYSLWCAEVGNQSSGPFVGLNNSAPGVQEYDDNMQADFSVNLHVNGYTSLTLSFFYFIKTENGGGDWIQAWFDANGTQTVIFSPRGSSAGGWTNVTLAVPNDIDRLIIRFHSDSANHGFEGAYVDDIVLVGTENVPPTSSVSTLPAYTNQEPYLVPYTAQDNANASGVDYVELWYRVGTSGAYTMYTTASNPLGQWSGPTIPFDASVAKGDGTYEFYTVAVDRASNVEGVPASPDATMTIDTTAPALSVTAPSQGGSVGDSHVVVQWQGSDALSGIDHYEVALDGGSPHSAGTALSYDLSGLSDGEHTVTVWAFDRAGNAAQFSVSFTISSFPWWIILLIIAIIVAGLLFLLYWRRRKQEEKEEAAGGEGKPTGETGSASTEPEAGPSKPPEG